MCDGDICAGKVDDDVKRLDATELNDFLCVLKQYSKCLTRHEAQTLRGQALRGEVAAAVKGLNRLLKRKTA